MMAIWKDSSVSIRTLCWILLIAIVLVCMLPLLLTQFSIVDFTDTGEIGDTIGGIMGPFVAIIASFLTFLAFLMQWNMEQGDGFSLRECGDAILFHRKPKSAIINS